MEKTLREEVEAELKALRGQIGSRQIEAVIKVVERRLDLIRADVDDIKYKLAVREAVEER